MISFQVVAIIIFLTTNFMLDNVLTNDLLVELLRIFVGQIVVKLTSPWFNYVRFIGT